MRSPHRIDYPLTSYLDRDDLINYGTEGRWLANDRGGKTLHNISVYRNDGTFVAAAPTDWVTISHGGAVALDGATKYIDCGDVARLSFGNGVTDQPFSVSLWFYMVNPAGNYIFVSKRSDHLSNGSEWWLGAFSGGQVNFTCGDSTVGNRIGRITSGIVLSAGTLYHLVGTYDGGGTVGSFRIYLNDVRVDDTNDSAGAYAAMHNSAAPVRFGAYEDGGGVRDFLNAQISNITIRRGVFSRSDVRRLNADYYAGIVHPLDRRRIWKAPTGGGIRSLAWRGGLAGQGGLAGIGGGLAA